MSVDEQRVVEEKFQKIVHDAGLHRWHVVQGYESIETTRLALKAQLERLWQQQVEYWTVNLPGIAGRMTVFDLGVVGQFGLLLIMVWFYYASRRENHSLRAFVDIREEIQKYNMNPDRFTLAPEEPSLQVQHYVYAYHAVAQRFLFLVSRRSTALMLTLICLIALPLAVASYNFLTDVRDVLGIPAVGTQGWIRVGLECFLLIGVAITSFRVVAFQCQTGVLLNGWYLACRDCWQPEHDNESATRSVKIDRVMQRARYPRKKSRDLRAESIAVGRG